jgi:hypothetical protein
MATEYRKQDVVDVLRRTGCRELAEEAERVLPDPVDFETLDELAAPYDLTIDELVSRMGGSP